VLVARLTRDEVEMADATHSDYEAIDL
jgi:hypothetical protein